MFGDKAPGFLEYPTPKLVRRDADAQFPPRERRTLNVLRRIEARQFTETGHQRRRRWFLPAAGTVSVQEY
jgi:hypothetical protein